MMCNDFDMFFAEEISTLKSQLQELEAGKVALGSKSILLEVSEYIH